MDEVLSYCGLICRTCPIHEATKEENIEKRTKMRIEISRLCKEHYGMNYEPEDITDCDGCKAASGRLFPACSSCKIRSCARQRGLENCAFCAEYICDTLQAFFATDLNAKIRLKKVRRGIRARS
jgi:hypothetical protein